MVRHEIGPTHRESETHAQRRVSARVETKRCSLNAPERAQGLEEDTILHCLVELDQIVPYEHDPRQSPNSEYVRIKASIRAQGVDQPLVVTRRPDANHYVVAAGGNTRLRIVRELFDETRDPKFARITCVFKPWRGEAEIMLAHLRENDLRGGLSFLDKARAVHEIRQMLESEQGQVTLTQGDLTRLLKARGYALSQTSLSNMDYAVEILESRLPVALRAGLGHGEVIRIRAFERVAHALWTDRVLVSEESFDEVFTLLCQRYDGPEWDFLSLRQAFEAEIAERLNQSIHAVRLALDARLAGVVETALPSRDENDEWWPEPAEPKPRLRSERVEQIALQPVPSDDNREDHTGPTETAAETRSLEHPSWAAPSPRVIAPELEPDGQTPSDGSECRIAQRTDLPALRVEFAALASAFASRHGLGQLILPLAECGTGFLVIDVPEPALLEVLDEAALAQVSMIWWQLIACAEMTVAPINCLLPHLAPSTVLYRALRDQDAGLLFNAVWTLDPGQLGFRLWRTLGDEDWSDLQTLMIYYRKVHRAADLTGAALWRTPA